MRSVNRRRRGTTLLELVLVIALQMIVLGAVATLYLFTVQQCGQATAAVGPLEQANAAMDAMTATIRQSMVCAAVKVGSVTGLRCTLPGNAFDTDGDGVADAYAPDKYDANGKATYSKGTRVWYYLADSTGAFGTTGTVLWRATRTDDKNPTAADVDASWSLYYAGKPRYGLIDTLGFTVSGASAYVTVAISASASARAPESSGASADVRDQQITNLSQTASWRTDFE